MDTQAAQPHLPTSAELAAYRLVLACDPRMHYSDPIGVTSWNDGPPGATAYERDHGIGNRTGDGYSFAGETRSWPAALRGGDRLFHE